MGNTIFNNCDITVFNNCDITINHGSSSESSEKINPVAGLAVFGGIMLALNPALMGTVVSTAIGATLLGVKGLALGGIGYSTAKTLSILKDSKKEQKLLETKKMDCIETTYAVKDI